MERLQEEKDHYRKHQGLDMDDPRIAVALHKLQLEEVKDEEVVMYYTRLNHLEQRVKNISIINLIQGQKSKNKKAALAKVILDAASQAAKITRQNTASLGSDGLISRLTEKIIETKDKIERQTKTLGKIRVSID